MPLSLSKLVSNRVPVDIDFGGGDVLHVEYHPAKITSEMLATIAAIGHPEQLTEERAIEVLDSATGTLLTLLASWDLVDGPKGREKPVPIDRDHLRALGATIQWTILNGVLRAQTGEAAAPEASANTPPSGAIS